MFTVIQLSRNKFIAVEETRHKLLFMFVVDNPTPRKRHHLLITW